VEDVVDAPPHIADSENAETKEGSEKKMRKGEANQEEE
jgi:hypothetical protein